MNPDDGRGAQVTRLTMTLGLSATGEAFAVGLETLPHLLVAGGTPAELSRTLARLTGEVALGVSPDRLKIVVTSLGSRAPRWFDGAPHLLTPAITDARAAARALSWAVRMMEVRYRILLAAGVRSLEQYNGQLDSRSRSPSSRPGGTEGPRPMPRIVIVVDELEPLVWARSLEVEDDICRLAQMARATGIHLVLATARPTPDVLTGLIKANMPARLALRAESKSDSRAILDCNGAEELGSGGDMLFLPPSQHRPIRVRGRPPSDAGIEHVARRVRLQGRPSYDPTLSDEPLPEGAGEDDR